MRHLLKRREGGGVRGRLERQVRGAGLHTCPVDHVAVLVVPEIQRPVGHKAQTCQEGRPLGRSHLQGEDSLPALPVVDQSHLGDAVLPCEHVVHTVVAAVVLAEGTEPCLNLGNVPWYLVGGV